MARLQNGNINSFGINNSLSETNNFLKALAVTLELEKDAGDKISVTEVGKNVTLSVGDKGGLTNDGIIQTVYNKYYKGSVANLTTEQRNHIYYKEYWLPCRCGEMPAPLGLMVFDYAVNSGVFQASKDLQRALNVFGCKLKVDGKIGPATAGQVTKVCLGRQKMLSLKAEFADRRLILISKILIKDSSQAKFMLGWVRRIWKINEASIVIVLAIVF